jgi:hypothetical protein
MSLREVLLAVVSGGGGAIVYWLMDHVKPLETLRPDYKRYASLALSAVLPVLAWLIMLGLGYDAPPPTWQGWLEQAFALAAGAILVSQGVHGAAKLRPQ